ncbi:TIGR02281 family clan AA aspartic protease [Thioclava sp. BHET1]|nr:TIGR02281 family clan AA aspartic protease [Thioclava sp. BHET1]
MTSDQILQALYFVILGAAIGGALMVQGRRNLGRFAQQLVIWILIFVAAIAAYGLWPQISRGVIQQQAVMGPSGSIVIPRGWDGHYHVTLHVDGVAVNCIVDTGATDLVLTLSDARKIGIDTRSLAFTGRAQTANGTVKTASVRLRQVRLGDVSDRDVRAEVNGGQLDQSLLGMSYLQRFGTIQIRGDRMTLTR